MSSTASELGACSLRDLGNYILHIESALFIDEDGPSV